MVKCERELLGRSGAHGREEKEAPFAVSPMGILEVCKSLKRAVRAAIAPERAEKAVGNALGHGAGWQAMKCEVCTESDKDAYGYDAEV
jgi:hypothetical protein